MAVEIKAESAFVEITPAALQQVKAVIEQQTQKDLFLRVFVQGGCGGISYGMAIDMRKQSDDTEFDISGLKVVVDRISYQYVEGSIVDYDTSGEKSGFRITNPNAAALQGAGGCCSTSESGSGCGSASGGCGSGGGGCC